MKSEPESARRKFTEADKGSGKTKKPGSVDVALGYIRRIYAVEVETHLPTSTQNLPIHRV